MTLEEAFNTSPIKVARKVGPFWIRTAEYWEGAGEYVLRSYRTQHGDTSTLAHKRTLGGIIHAANGWCTCSAENFAPGASVGWEPVMKR